MTTAVWSAEWFIVDNVYLNLINANATKEDAQDAINCVGSIESLQHITKNVPMKFSYCWCIKVKNGNFELIYFHTHIHLFYSLKCVLRKNILLGCRQGGD
jgi:hypothetical protein